MSEEGQQCSFCHIANGKVPAKKIYEDDKVTAVLDINPATKGHILLLTKEHYSIMPQMDDSLIAHIGMTAKQLSQSLISGLKAEGTSIFVANGVAAGQRAPHFMLHVIPRRKGDNVALHWPPGKLENIQELLQKVAEPIKKHFGTDLKVEAPKEKPKKASESKVEEKTETKTESPKKETEKKEEAPKEKPKDEGVNLDAIAGLFTK